jgi:hypothetical protein
LDRSRLVDTVRAALEALSRVRELEGEVSTLQAECKRFRNVIWNQEDQIWNTGAQTRASIQEIAKVKGALSVSVDVLNNAHLFDARLEKENHLFKSRIIRFLMKQAYRMEETTDRMQLLVDSVIPEMPQLEHKPLPIPTHQEIQILEATQLSEGRFPEDKSISRKRKMVTTTSLDSFGDHVVAPSSILYIPEGLEWTNLVVLTEEEIAWANRASGEKTTPIQF